MLKDFINIHEHAIEIFTYLTIGRKAHVDKLYCGTTFSALG